VEPESIACLLRPREPKTITVPAPSCEGRGELEFTPSIKPKSAAGPAAQGGGAAFYGQASQALALCEGRRFIRAYDAEVFRSLTNREFIDFLEALQEMPWSWRNRLQEAKLPTR
jgi:hypothetical protein